MVYYRRSGAGRIDRAPREQKMTHGIGKMGRSPLLRAARQVSWGVALVGLMATAACTASSGGGGGGVMAAGTPGTACAPDKDTELCLGAARVACDANMSAWTQKELCPAGSSCITIAAGKTGCSASTTADSQSGGSDVAAVQDVKADVGAAPDSSAADAAKADTAAKDVAPDVPPQDTQPPTGIMTIAEIQKASAACPAPEAAAWGELPGVTIQGAVVVSPARKMNADGTFIGLYVQQGGGQWNGLFAVGQADGPLGSLKLGDKVDLTGDVKDFYCVTELFVTAATTQAAGMTSQTSVVTTYQVGDQAGPAKSEAWEGVLVSLSDVVASGDALGTDGKPHGDFFVGLSGTDQALRVGAGFPGIYTSVKQPDGTFAAKYPLGTKLGKVHGVIDYNFGTYRLLLTEDPSVVLKP